MPHSLIDIPADVLRDPLLAILRARLDTTDLVSLSLTCRTFATLVRPFLFESLAFTEGAPFSKTRVESLAAAASLTPLVQKLVFEPADTEGQDEQANDYWLAFTHLLPRLVGLRSIVCNYGAMPPEEFWNLVETSRNVKVKAIELEDAFDDEGPPPAFFKIRGLSSLRFVGDREYRWGAFPPGPSAKVQKMVFRNRHTLEQLETHSRRLALNEVLVPARDGADAPTYPVLSTLDLCVNCRGTRFPTYGEEALADWFQALMPHLPELETMILHPGVDTARSYDLFPAVNPMAPSQTLTGPNLMPLVYATADVNPFSETTLLPLLLTSKTVGHLPRIRKLVLMRPPSLGEHGEADVEYVPLGRKDLFDLFPAIKGLEALEELSVTLGEVDVEILTGLADAVGGGKLRSLEIDLRVLKKTNVEADEDEFDGDGLLWADEQAPFAAALSPLARSLVSFVVADNRTTAARALLADADRDPSNQDTFDFLPTLLVFAHQLWNLTSVRWITRDGRGDDALVRDQLWVAAVGGGWMRLVG